LAQFYDKSVPKIRMQRYMKFFNYNMQKHKPTNLFSACNGSVCGRFLSSLRYVRDLPGSP